MYYVVPWDEPGKYYPFESFIDALQYGDSHFGSRYDIVMGDSLLKH